MTLKVIALSGGLDKNSCASGLLRACLLLNNPELNIQVMDISSFPLFNFDIILDQGYPQSVK